MAKKPAKKTESTKPADTEKDANAGRQRRPVQDAPAPDGGFDDSETAKALDLAMAALMRHGHTEHCAKRQVWGDGECGCGAMKPAVTDEPQPPDDHQAALGLALSALVRDGHTPDCARTMAWDGELCACGANEPDAEPSSFPRRRFMVSVQISADDAGGVARSLLDLINWTELVERRGGDDLGHQDHMNGDRTRSFHATLDDEPEITHDAYEAALAAWKADE